MTMFEELYTLATGATLAMVISADEKSGKMTINVVPKPKKDMGEPALSKDLSLTATPAEFDADFVRTLTGYREARDDLIKQAEATQTVLQAATAASAKKAGEAVAKAAKSPTTAPKATPAPAPAPAQSADDEHDDEDGTGAGASPQPATTAAVTGGQSFDLFG